MTGLARDTLRRLTPLAHLAQSVEDILFTPLGSRVMRRDYGSRLPDLIDAPINGETVIEVYAATAEALDRWEPRLDLQRVQVARADVGYLALDLTVDYDARIEMLSVEGGVK